jgi:glyoxylase-like metal-dependent hydrolase (beta-lactamase superfamily II)/rhodanese-related sulfurtransferase
VYEVTPSHSRNARVHEALLVDPKLELMDDYRQFIADHALQLQVVIDTQLHSDHFSASHLLRGQYGAEIAMSHATKSARVTRRLVQNEKIKIGSLEFSVLETPGGALDALCLVGEGLVFTGNTLLIGSVARTDLQFSDVVASDPGVLWDSLHAQLAKLPGSTLVYPAYDSNELLFSTIGVELKNNPQLEISDRDSFVTFKAEESPPVSTTHMSDEARIHLAFNQAAQPQALADAGFMRPRVAPVAVMEQEPASIGVAKYAPKLKEKAQGSVFLDVREPMEFQEGHMPGVRNLPLSELGLHLAELATQNRIYLSCRSGARSRAAAKTLSYLGLKDVVDVSGGYQAWVASQFSVEKPNT